MVYLKNCLAENLKNGIDKDALDSFEDFQSRFVKEDERIALIRNEIAEIAKYHSENAGPYVATQTETHKKLNNLRCNIHDIQMEFGNLKTAFYSYLTKNSVV